MLFLNRATFAIRRIASNRDFETTGQGTLDFQYCRSVDGRNRRWVHGEGRSRPAFVAYLPDGPLLRCSG
jgi:hypothetical protein